jgi:hypothetical protein
MSDWSARHRRISFSLRHFRERQRFVITLGGIDFHAWDVHGNLERSEPSELPGVGWIESDYVIAARILQDVVKDRRSFVFVTALPPVSFATSFSPSSRPISSCSVRE